MKNLGMKIRKAFQTAVEQAGGKPELSRKSGIAYSMIHRFASGECDFHNMTMKTLEKIFPDMDIFFFGIEKERNRLAAMEDQLNAERKKLDFERVIFELERENWRLMRENDSLKQESFGKQAPENSHDF